MYCPSVTQGEGSHQKPTLLAPQSWISSFQNCEEALSVNLCYGSWASECFSTSCLTLQAHFDFSLPQPCLWRSWIPLSGQWYLVADLLVSGSTLLEDLLPQDLLSRQNLDRWMLLSEEDHTRLNLLESSFLLSSTRCWFLRQLVPLISH